MTVAGVLATGLALSSCAGSVHTDFSSGFSVQAAVATVPAAGDTERFDIMVADVAAIAELEGLDTSSATNEWLAQITGANAQVLVPLPEIFQPGLSDEAWDTLGWDISDVDRFVTFAAMPTTFTAVAGDLPSLPPSFTPVSDGVVTDIDAEDFAVDLSGRGTAIDPLARPTRFAQSDNEIIMSTSTELAEAWVAGSESLADDESVRAIAEALDAQQSLSAVITQPALFSGQTILGPDASAEQAAAALKTFDALVPPDPYDMVGLGWSVVDGQARWTAAYHFTNAQAATDGAQVLRAVWEKGATISTKQPISSFATVNDVTVKDSTVTVLLTPTADTRAQTLYQLLMSREVLFVTR